MIYVGFAAKSIADITMIPIENRNGFEIGLDRRPKLKRKLKVHPSFAYIRSLANP